MGVWAANYVSKEAMDKGVGYADPAVYAKMTDLIFANAAAAGDKKPDPTALYTNEFVGRLRLSDARIGARRKRRRPSTRWDSRIATALRAAPASVLAAVPAADYVVVDQLRKTYNPGTRSRSRRWRRARSPSGGASSSPCSGPRVCGKSTLLMMIAGLDLPSAGRIEVAARPPAFAARRDRHHVPGSTLLPWKSALDNVLFPFQAAKRPVGPHIDHAKALLDEGRSRGFHDHKPRQLSGGHAPEGGDLSGRWSTSPTCC
jgi:hypothetical protein